MPFPWVPLAIMGGGTILNRLLNPPQKAKFGVEPKDYLSQLTLSDADLSNIRSQGLQNLSMMNRGQINAIQQAGAARRMPPGAISSALAGSSYQAGRGAASIEPQLRQQQIGSFQDYLQLQQPYEMMKAQVGLQNQQQRSSFLQSGLGNIAKMFILWKAGYFDDELMGGANTGTKQFNPLTNYQYEGSYT